MIAIIAGSNKAGTTSLFRYLADHPQVAPSRSKETDFFLSDEKLDPADARARYESLFTARAGAVIRLEASPAYLRGGRAVALRIARTLPDVRLIFVLREPVSRLVSYLRVNAQNMYKESVAAMDDNSYVALVERVAAGASVPPEPGPMRNALLQYQRGCYAMYLQQYFECFKSSDVLILFFDDLRADAKAFTQRACAFVGADPRYYDDYQFAVENRTRNHRSARLQRSVARINAQLEPWLNRHPALRRALRGVYEFINERRRPARATHLDESLVLRLQAVFSPQNDALKRLLLSHYPELQLPQWLSDGYPPR
jgi:Sulfotransferase domain